MESLSRFRVVLHRPSHPGNIGAAARAMKTMGLKRLVLVAPRRFPDIEADTLSAGAVDVLENARVVQTIDEALAGAAIAVALSARPRDLSHAATDVRTAAHEVVSSNAEVALVFGNETAGLANEDVLKCNRLAYIPADETYSSLNLGAAVQVVSYEVRMAALSLKSEAAAPVAELATMDDVERLYQHLETSLRATGFLDPGKPKRLMERLRRLFGRARLEREEVNILRGMLSAWDDLGRRGK
jgi:tRNA/rRNA methyltransferase